MDEMKLRFVIVVLMVAKLTAKVMLRVGERVMGWMEKIEAWGRRMVNERNN